MIIIIIIIIIINKMHRSIMQKHNDHFSMTMPSNYYRVVSINNSKKQITVYIHHIDKNVNIDVNLNDSKYTTINPSIVMDDIGLSVFEPRTMRPFVPLPYGQREATQCEYDYWYYCNSVEYDLTDSNGVIWKTITEYIKENHDSFNDFKQLKSLDIDKYNVDEVLEDGCIIISKK